MMKFTQDVLEFSRRPFYEHHVRWETTLHHACDGVPCAAPGAPYDPRDPTSSHFHLVFSAPDLAYEERVYIDPLERSTDDGGGTWI